MSQRSDVTAVWTAQAYTLAIAAGAAVLALVVSDISSGWSLLVVPLAAGVLVGFALRTRNRPTRTITIYVLETVSLSFLFMVGAIIVALAFGGI